MYAGDLEIDSIFVWNKVVLWRVDGKSQGSKTIDITLIGTISNLKDIPRTGSMTTFDDSVFRCAEHYACPKHSALFLGRELTQKDQRRKNEDRDWFNPQMAGHS